MSYPIIQYPRYTLLPSQACPPGGVARAVRGLQPAVPPVEQPGGQHHQSGRQGAAAAGDMDNGQCDKTNKFLLLSYMLSSLEPQNGVTY